jgi:hypothetical protein
MGMIVRQEAAKSLCFMKSSKVASYWPSHTDAWLQGYQGPFASANTLFHASRPSAACRAGFAEG